VRTIIKAPTEPAGDLRQALFQYCAEHLAHYNPVAAHPDATVVNRHDDPYNHHVT